MKPIRLLKCCCCGQLAKGRQWHNRDKGYGLCNRCAEVISKNTSCEDMQSCYGKQGIHYLIEEGTSAPSST